jgi:group I intron endonuclease
MFVLYVITNTINEKVYIGKTNNIRTRKNSHFAKLRNGDHYNSHLQHAWNKYGEDNFKFETFLKTDTDEELMELEKYYIRLSKSHNPDYGYNLTFGGEGGRFTDEMKLIISKRFKGVLKSAEHKKKIGEAHKKNPYWKGKKQSEHTRLLKSIHGKNQKQSDFTKKKRALRQTGEGNHRFGKSGKLSASFGVPSKIRKKVVCFKNNEPFITFLSYRYARIFIGQYILSKCLRFNFRSKQGFTFKYNNEVLGV